MEYYLHHVPGRLRLKIPALKKNRNASDELKKLLSTLYGILTIEINPITGSLLVNYQPAAVKQGDIVRMLERHGYFDSSKASGNDHFIRSAASKAGNIFGKAVLGAFVEKALEGSALSLLAILI